MFYLFHIFRSFIPLLNPIGFGAGDFVELFVAAALVLLVSGAKSGGSVCPSLR